MQDCLPLAGIEGFEEMIASKVGELFIRVCAVQYSTLYIIQYTYSCGVYDVRQDAKREMYCVPLRRVSVILDAKASPSKFDRILPSLGLASRAFYTVLFCPLIKANQ